MTWELFQRRDRAAGGRRAVAQGAPEIRVYRTGTVALTRAAAEICGLAAGARVLVLHDREAGVVALLPSEDPAGWKVCAGASGTLAVSLAAFLRRLGARPGAYPLETFEHEGVAVPGFRLAARLGAAGERA